MSKIVKKSKYGEFTILLDKEDYNRLELNKISLSPRNKNIKGDKTFYVYYRISTYKKMGLHRYLLNCPKGLVVDHINHRTTDNRRSNLKICTHYQNMQNISSNTSGKVGVSYETKRKKWNAQIKVKRKHINLGCYNTKEEAIEARLKAEKKYYN